jgi:hypothetical protein
MCTVRTVRPNRRTVRAQYGRTKRTVRFVRLASAGKQAFFFGPINDSSDRTSGK